MKGYPPWFLPILAGVLLVILASGLLLVPTTLVMRAELMLAWRLPGAARIVTAAAHTCAGFAAMLLLGSVWSVHMRSGWRRGKHRASGVALALMFVVLCVTAVAIFYLADEALGALAAFVHLAVGVALTAQFGWHWVHGRRSKRQTLSACSAPDEQPGTRRFEPGAHQASPDQSPRPAPTRAAK